MTKEQQNPEVTRGPIEAERPKPGPEYALPPTIGSVDHDPTKFKNPAYSIGMPHQDEKSVVPGPNKYNYADNLTAKGKQDKPYFSLQSRPKVKDQEWTPGPAFYKAENVKYGTLSSERTPRTTAVVGKEAYQWKNFAPPPTKYFVPRPFGTGTSDLKGGNSWSIQESREYGGSHYEGKVKNTPCASRYGAVEPHIYKRRTPSYSQQGRTKVPVYNTALGVPGPGTYNPKAYKSDRNSGSTFGTRHSTYTMPLFTMADVNCT